MDILFSTFLFSIGLFVHPSPIPLPDLTMDPFGPVAHQEAQDYNSFWIDSLVLSNTSSSSMSDMA